MQVAHSLVTIIRPDLNLARGCVFYASKYFIVDILILHCNRMGVLLVTVLINLKVSNKLPRITFLHINKYT